MKALDIALWMFAGGLISTIAIIINVETFGLCHSYEMCTGKYLVFFLNSYIALWIIKLILKIYKAKTEG